MKNTRSTIENSHTMMHKYIGMIVFLFILLSFTTDHTLFAQGSMLLTPKRVVFEGTKNSESINLANLGKDTARYVISLVEYKMKEDGGFEEITQKEAGQFSAVPYIRFFPRTVTLAPNEAQVIRMQLNKKPGQMASGEYRSHLYVRAMPKPTPMGEREVEQSTTIGVKLVPVFGVSIPVIIRVGESRTAASITGLSITTTKDPTNLNLMLNRSGNMSIYGDINVKHISPSGKSTVVAVVKGLAVYAPNTIRYVALPLNKNLDVNYHSGKLVTQFINGSDSKDKKIVESELALY